MRSPSGRTIPAADTVLVFAYGSLMHPDSLAATIPDARAALPASCRGFRRCFDVAFPNDGTQPDKAYLDPDGRRPPAVLFANLHADPAATVNGVCIPLGPDGLARLRSRELRYDLVDLTGRVHAYPGAAQITGRVVAFLGRARFTDPAEVATGVTPHAYHALVREAAGYWDARCPGFLADFESSTDDPATADLRRIDL